jgi:hypothetical protein
VLGKEKQVKGKMTLILTCLTVAATVALLATPPVRARASSPHRPAHATLARELRSMTGPQQLVPNPVRPTGSSKSYFWSDVTIAAAVLMGLLIFGLWGDRAVGGVIFGIELLCVGAAWMTRNVPSHAFARYRRRLLPNMRSARVEHGTNDSSPSGPNLSR